MATVSKTSVARANTAPRTTGEAVARTPLHHAEAKSGDHCPANSSQLIRDVLKTPGEPLDPNTRDYFEPRFFHDFGAVRVHHDTQASAAARSVDARAFAFGHHLVFSRGAFSPHSPEGRRVLGHELVHVAQSARQPAAPHGDFSIAELSDPAEQTASRLGDLVMQGEMLRSPIAPTHEPKVFRLPTSLSAIPQTERAALRVGTVDITVPPAEVAAVFATTGTRASRSNGGQTAFGTGIAPALQPGLTSIGAYITNQTNGLPLNSTLEVALDLTAYGGANSLYRFTWFAHTENGTASNVMLIELVGVVAAAPAATTVPNGTFSVGGQNFTLAGSWNAANFGLLQHAIGLLPARALTEAAGLTFRRRSGNGPGTEAGEYSPSTDTVSLFDNAFDDHSVRFGGAPGSERAILHEIGHAADLRPLERAWNTFNTGGQTAAGRTTFLGTRSPSGSRYVAGAGGNYDQDLNLGATDGAFRTAVRADGVRRDTTGRTLSTGGTANLSRGITEYSDTDYQELFAELYSLYVSNPSVLQQLRPQTFAYFRTRYPRP